MKSFIAGIIFLLFAFIGSYKYARSATFKGKDLKQPRYFFKSGLFELIISAVALIILFVIVHNRGIGN